MTYPLNWTAGDISGSQTLTDNDNFYVAHINELRSALNNAYKINVLDYGATGNGTDDDTAAIQSAIAAAASTGRKHVYFPSGNYLISSSLTSSVGGMVWEGSNANTTRFKVNGSFNALSLSHGAQYVTNFLFEPVVAQTSGYSIAASTYGSHIFHNLTVSTFGGISVTSSNDNMITNIHSSGNKGYGIIVGGTTINNWFANLNMGSAAGNTSSGFYHGANTNSNYLIHASFLGFAEGMTILGGNFWADHSIADGSSNTGININSDAQSIYFNNCWAGSSTNVGIIIAKGTDVWLRGTTAINNGQNGIIVSSSGTNGSGVNIVNCDVVANSTQGSGSYAGIRITPDISNFSIIGCRCGPVAGGLLNYQSYGIQVEAGDSDRYIISLNNCYNNVSGGVDDNGTGLNKVVANNITA